MKLSVLVNDQIDKTWFDRMLEMEHVIFPPEGNDYLPSDYVRELYSKSQEGLFFCIDEENDCLAGYLTIIFISEEQKNHYLNEGGHFSELKNIGVQKGSNIMYIYTAAMDEKYRGSKGMKLIGKEFAKWLDEKEEEGCHADEIYVEAVSEDGARTIVKGFGMQPYHVDEKGIGHYYALDRLVEYRKKMKNV